ncbi:complement C3-like [Silurus meridionalis]|uniref:complement C3-like n=1 Tax=Silurus meridionalis TaxID=175797 RepID=UPI001EECBD16|nr:complement C3-like [Silurus meridionalis]
MGVFYDAGLLVQSDKAGGTKERTDNQCPKPPKRKRRAETLVEITQTLVGKYKDDLKKCCTDGIRPNRLGYTCERRSAFIVEGPECIKAFLDCCKEIQSRKDKQSHLLHLAHSDNNDDDFISSDEIVTGRSSQLALGGYKPASLLRKPMYHNKRHYGNKLSKDSITTWQLLAISLSKTHGICVADPFEITVAKEFFVDLKLPYSAVHNEQVEIKAILYNFSNKLQKVRVEFFETENICSAASKKKKYRTIVNVDPKSSRSVPFVFIPMKIGEHHIEVKVASSSHHDGVMRTLKVVVSINHVYIIPDNPNKLYLKKSVARED